MLCPKNAGPQVGLLLWGRGRRMAGELEIRRAVTFIDGQNLYHAARKCFDRPIPDYDVVALSEAVCAIKGWHLVQVRFYTGIHRKEKNQYWHEFWAVKLNVLRRGSNVHVFSQYLSYHDQATIVAGREVKRPVAVEKGIDLRLGLDAVRLAREQAYDEAIIFSQDADLAEVAKEIRQIAREQSRFIGVSSAFPENAELRHENGIPRTSWIPIDHDIYANCLDRRDYGRGGRRQRRP